MTAELRVYHYLTPAEFEQLAAARVLARALVSGKARWEPWSDERRGEVCVGGLRYATELLDGVPVMYPALRYAIEFALKALP